MVTWLGGRFEGWVSMMTVRPEPVDGCGGQCPKSDRLRAEAGPVGWSCEVVLEMWIDDGQEPINLRLAGTLDETTEDYVLSVVGELVAQGARSFSLQTSELELAFGGLEALVALERLVSCAGGQLTGAVHG